MGSAQGTQIAGGVLSVVGALTWWTGVGTWAIIGGLGMIAGAATTVAGGYQQASEMKAAAKDANIQADNAEKMAEYERTRAQQAFKRGEAEARRRSLLLAQQQGANRASAAGSGLLVDDNAGATLDDIYASNLINAEQDINIINENANLQVMAHSESRARMLQEAGTLRNQARAYRRGANKAVAMGFVQAGLNVGLSMLGGYFASEAIAASSTAASQAAIPGAGSFTSTFAGSTATMTTAELSSQATMYGMLATGTMSLVAGGTGGQLTGGLINTASTSRQLQRPIAVQDAGYDLVDYGGKTMGGGINRNTIDYNKQLVSSYGNLA